MRLYDTLSRTVQDVTPLEDDHVRLYTCGPTVYARVHIGNFRTFIFEDVLRRWLERRFARVTQVMNLTDVEDKIIRNAVAHHATLDEETAPHIAEFFEDLETLGLLRAHHYPRATEFIEPMVRLIEKLQANGLTYESEGSIYFRIAAFPQYGRLSGAQSRELEAGASGRVDADEYDKEDARDFALWKAVGAGEIGWDTRLGRGRPGWHIECSAMSMGLLGESFDIHCGGVDNIFPHHENEIAQSEAATGKPFVHIWCHSEHLRIGGEKMAKSAGNFATVPELVAQGNSAAALRYLLAAGAHYRKPLNFTAESLHMATEAVDRIVEFRERLGLVAPKPGRDALVAVAQRIGEEFAAAMDDDLNLPEAMGIFFAGVREINRHLDKLPASAADLAALQKLLTEVDAVLGILALADRDHRDEPLTAEEQRWLDERAAARNAKNWAESDRLRDLLARSGVVVEDTAGGQKWTRRVHVV